MHINELLLDALEHENFSLRSHALLVLSEQPSLQSDAAMRSFRQFEKYGWEKSYEYPHLIGQLPYVREAVDWMGQFILDEAAANHEFHAFQVLVRWFLGAPTEWLEAWQKPINDLCSNSTRSVKSSLTDWLDRMNLRIEMAQWSEQQCREHLDEILKKCANFDRLPDFGGIPLLEVACKNLAELDYIKQAELENWLHLSKRDREGEDPDSNTYRIGAALIILEHRRQPPPTAAVIQVFDIDWDWFNEQIETTLSTSGTLTTLQEIAELYPQQEWHARLYLTGVFSSLMHPKFESTLCELFDSEVNEDLKISIAQTLAHYEGDQARQRVEGYIGVSDIEANYAIEMMHLNDVLRGKLTSSEAEILLAEQQRNYDKEHSDKKQERFAELNALLIKAAENFGKSRKTKVGRNDPCPCGSGKKYKKCCI